MRLDAVLQKTKKRGEALSKQLPKTQIAFADRPYDLSEEKDSLVETNEEPGNKQETNIENVSFNDPGFVENREQTGNKLGTGRGQTENIKLETIPANGKNSDNESKQFEQSNRNLLQNSEKTGNKLETNWKHDSSKPIVTLVITKQSILFLVGLQREALLFLYQECKRTRSETTGAITLDRIGEQICASQDVVKTTLRRLEKKGYVERVDFKNGRGGWTRYKMPDKVYQEILIMESDLFFSQGIVTSEKKEPLIVHTNTKDERVVPVDKLPQEWEEIDISVLSSIKFTKEHLFQIYKIGKFNADNIQEFINAFAFDLAGNKKAEQFKSGPLNFFMGILRKGSPYLPSENYESPQDRAMRQYVQYKKAKESKQKELEKEAMEFSFDEWEKELSDDKVLSICQGNACANDRTSVFRKGYLIAYFKENIWKEKKSTFVQKIDAH